MTRPRRPFEVLESPAVVLLRGNVDTDQIIPARFLRKPREGTAGYAPYLFADLDDAPAGLRGEERGDGCDGEEAGGEAAPEILIAGRNFGCGSSREGAVYALVDAGYRAVVAESFGDIFRANAARNGLLCVQLAPEEVGALAAAAAEAPAARLTVDLPAQSVAAPGLAAYHFAIDGFSKKLLRAGYDELDLTLSLAGAIADFSAAAEAARPWLRPETTGEA